MNPFALLIDLVIPRECHICGNKLLEEEEFVCNDCLNKLPATGYEKYWNNISGVNTDLNPMEQRFAGQLPLDRAIAPFFYTRDSSLASLVHDFKYRGFSRLAVKLGKEGASRIAYSGFFSDTDIILPIPLHWRKRLKRGYNQSEQIAKGVSEVTGIPVGRQLRARKAHRTQTSLTSEERIKNTQGIFYLDQPEELEGKTVLLIDDICTTGATLLSAGEAIAASAKGIRLKIFTLGVV